jgi:hypothetical protein
VRYLRWDETAVSGIDQVVFGLVETWTEVGDDGFVRRELGFDAAGHICHRCPSPFYRHGRRGTFDMAPIDLAGTEDDPTPAEFERRWLENEFAGLTHVPIPTKAEDSPANRALRLGCILAAVLCVVGIVAVSVLIASWLTNAL